MTKVLHVFGALSVGGAELRTLELVRRLARSDVYSDFLVFSSSIGSLEAEAVAVGAGVYHVPLDVRFPLRLRSLIRRNRYDVVHSHVHYFSGVILRIAASADVPVRIAHFRTTADDHTAHGWRRRAQRMITKQWIDRYATKILAVSQGVLSEAWNEAWCMDPRCKAVYNGFDPARFVGANGEIRLGDDRRFDDAHPLVVHVGSCQPRKNQEKVLKAFSHIRAAYPRAILAFAGRWTTPYATRLDGLIQCLGLTGSVCRLGELTDVVPLLMKSDVMLFPSRWEGLPGAVIEAAACGTPVLASPLSGIREVSAHLPGIATLPLETDDAEWGRRAIELWLDSERDGLRRKSNEALAASPFSIDRAVAALRECWQEVPGRS